VGVEVLAAVRLVITDKIDLAGQDNKQAVSAFANAQQRFTVGEMPHFPESAQPLEFRRLQMGEHLMAPRIANRHDGSVTRLMATEPVLGRARPNVGIRSAPSHWPFGQACW
jgi:hypothetical protein